MPWSYFYLVVGRVFQFMILLGRGDRTKEIEILALGHQVDADITVTRRDRLGGLLHEYSQVA